MAGDRRRFPMTAEGDLTEAVAWRVLDQVADEARKEVVKQGLKEN